MIKDKKMVNGRSRTACCRHSGFRHLAKLYATSKKGYFQWKWEDRGH